MWVSLPVRWRVTQPGLSILPNSKSPPGRLAAHVTVSRRRKSIGCPGTKSSMACADLRLHRSPSDRRGRRLRPIVLLAARPGRAGSVLSASMSRTIAALTRSNEAVTSCGRGDCLGARRCLLPGHGWLVGLGGHDDLGEGPVTEPAAQVDEFIGVAKGFPNWLR